MEDALQRKMTSNERCPQMEDDLQGKIISKERQTPIEGGIQWQTTFKMKCNGRRYQQPLYRIELICS